MKKISIKQKKYNISKMRKANKVLKKINKRKRRHKKVEIIKRKESKSILKTFLNEKEFYKKTRGIEKKGIFVIPEIFSFSKNPEETIRKLKKLCYMLRNKKINQIFIDHSKCEYLGISASTVMDAIITEYKNDNPKLGFRGKISNNEKVNNMIKHSGIMKHLDIKVEEDKNTDVLPWMKNIDETKAANAVLEYFLKCLKKQGMGLKEEGESYLLEMVSEIVQNCQYHGGKHATWYILGHANTLDDGKEEMQITIFNFGNTIYESYLLDDTSKDMMLRLKELNKEYKNINKVKPDEEVLWTLYSLQEKVSRFWSKETNPNDQRYSSTRGSGMMSLIRNLYSIGFSNEKNYKPIMSILSGRVHIIFGEDVDYKNLNFNSQNSIYYPPDNRNVKKINNYFPGTVISMKFYLDGKYLRRIINEN